jgi:hypothetical protein
MDDPDIGSLRAQAARCRRLAAGVGDRRTAQALNQMAEEYDARAVAAGEAYALRATRERDAAAGWRSAGDRRAWRDS